MELLWPRPVGLSKILKDPKLSFVPGTSVSVSLSHFRCAFLTLNSSRRSRTPVFRGLWGVARPASVGGATLWRRLRLRARPGHRGASEGLLAPELLLRLWAQAAPASLRPGGWGREESQAPQCAGQDAQCSLRVSPGLGHRLGPGFIIPASVQSSF